MKALALAVCASLLLLASCATWSDSELDTYRDRVQASIETAEAERVAAPPEELPQIEARLSELRAALEGLNALRDIVQAERPQLEREEQAAELVGALVPGWGAAASAVLGGVVVWLRQGRYRRSLEQIVRGLDRAKAADPTLAQAFNANTDRIRAQMDLLTARVIDEIRGK